MRWRWAVGVLLLLPAAGLRAQSRYDMYGEVVDVTINDLVGQGPSYDGRAVRTKGRLEMMPTVGQRYYLLKDRTWGSSVVALPVQEVSSAWDTEAPKMSGKEVEITGVFRSGTVTDAGTASGSGQRPASISFWKFLGPPEEVKGDIKADTVSLESVVSNPGRYDDRTIRIFGRFRGKNLYGDLPGRSERDSHDWVVKDDLFAAWVTGRKPKGVGFELDPNLKRDTEKWLEIVATPETIHGITYLRAVRISLGGPPPANVASGEAARSGTKAAALSPPPERPKVPPEVVFALPLDGDAEVPANGHFQIQFSKDMDAQTFKGRVVIRYAGPPRAGDRSFDGAKIIYEDGPRALTVDPGDVLRPGRAVEILLLPGIVDIDGMELVARPGRSGAPAGATDVLRYQVLAQTLFGANR
jgi:hypothetical protein